jgi:hypothetical protein
VTEKRCIKRIAALQRFLLFFHNFADLLGHKLRDSGLHESLSTRPFKARGLGALFDTKFTRPTMSSLKSAVLFSLFSGVSFADLQRAARQREQGQVAPYPTAEDVAHAARFTAPAQASVQASAPVEDDSDITTRDAA